MDLWSGNEGSSDECAAAPACADWHGQRSDADGFQAAASTKFKFDDQCDSDDDIPGLEEVLSDDELPSDYKRGLKRKTSSFQVADAEQASEDSGHGNDVQVGIPVSKAQRLKVDMTASSLPALGNTSGACQRLSTYAKNGMCHKRLKKVLGQGCTCKRRCISNFDFQTLCNLTKQFWHLNKDDQDYLFLSLCTGSGLTETEEDLDEWKDDCSSEDSDVSVPR